MIKTVVKMIKTLIKMIKVLINMIIKTVIKIIQLTMMMILLNDAVCFRCCHHLNCCCTESFHLMIFEFHKALEILQQIYILKFSCITYY